MFTSAHSIPGRLAASLVGGALSLMLWGCAEDPMAQPALSDAGQEPELKLKNVRYRYYEGSQLVISGTAAEIGYNNSSGAVLSHDLVALFHSQPDEADAGGDADEESDASEVGPGDENSSGEDAPGGSAAAVMTSEGVSLQASAASDEAADGDADADGGVEPPGRKRVLSEDIWAEAASVSGNLNLRWIDALGGVRLRDVNGTMAVTERASIDARTQRVFSETPVFVTGRGLVATAGSGFLMSLKTDRVLHFQGPIQSRIFSISPEDAASRNALLPPLPPIAPLRKSGVSPSESPSPKGERNIH